jgi:hypothetical protein
LAARRCTTTMSRAKLRKNSATNGAKLRKRVSRITKARAKLQPGGASGSRSACPSSFRATNEKGQRGNDGLVDHRPISDSLDRFAERRRDASVAAGLHSVRPPPLSETTNRRRAGVAA